MQRKQNNALPFSYRAIGIALFALCLLLLLWVAGHVHPDLATAASPTQSASGASGTAAASTAGTARTKAHMGAGSITSNVKSDKTLVVVKEPGAPHETGRKKFGAILGDNVEVGCNSVLNPGTVIGRRSNIYPTSSVRGVIPADSIYKDRDHVVTKEK